MIVVDGRPLEEPLTGVGRHVQGLLHHLAGDLALVVPDDRPLEHSGLRVVRLSPRMPDPAWNELRLAPYLRGASAYWTGNGQVPWRAPRSCTVVSTVHDLVHRNLEAAMPWRLRASRENALRASVRRADVLVVLSQSVSDELQQHYGRSADVVLPPSTTLPAADPAEVARLRAELDELLPGHRWVLAVGSLLPRKNLVRLAQAVVGLPQVALAVVGGGGDPTVAQALEAAASEVPLLRRGFVSQEELAAWYVVAGALAYPSLAEGFGLPLLDARAAGCPVVTSDRSPLRDNAGADAVLVDPLDVDAIARGLTRALEADRPAPELLAGWERGAAILAEPLGLRVMP